MAYADYTFYTTKFFGLGPKIEEDDFNRFAEMASDELDTMTHDRLATGLPANERATEKVKKAMCAVAEKLQEIEIAEKMAQAGGYVTDESGNIVGKIITSKSSGSESVSCSATTSIKSAVFNAVGDTLERDRQCLWAAKKYLTGVTDDCGVLLLYAGL